ncbi:MAG: hypothetical protein QG640_77 [Patescibacteria group bacterium]|nr:hypothetical protein [Patescibacteria group bacterium]
MQTLLWFVASFAVLLLISACVLYVRYIFKDNRSEALAECRELWQKIKKEAAGVGSIRALAQVDRLSVLCDSFAIEPKEFGAENLKQVAKDAEIAFCKWPGSRRFLDSPELAEFRKKYLTSSA